MLHLKLSTTKKFPYFERETCPLVDNLTLLTKSIFSVLDCVCVESTLRSYTFNFDCRQNIVLVCEGPLIYPNIRQKYAFSFVSYSFLAKF